MALNDFVPREGHVPVQLLQLREAMDVLHMQVECLRHMSNATCPYQLDRHRISTSKCGALTFQSCLTNAAKHELQGLKPSKERPHQPKS